VKFRNFLGANTAQQSYFKDGVETIYPSMDTVLKLAILPAYDPLNPNPTGWIPAVNGEDESDFYSVVRAAKFVGHGNRRAKTSFLSPRTFDLNADDPYDAFYDYCSRSDEWCYLTKDNRGRRLNGEVKGATFPLMKNYFAANVMDVTAGSRGGVFVAELYESVMKGILYSTKKNGARINGIAFERDSKGNLLFGDITDPRSALVVEIAFRNTSRGRTYVARPALDDKGNLMRVEIPETLLQHRQHMEEPSSFLIHPGEAQDIVDKLAGMLRGYKSPSGKDEIEALKEAMQFAYGDKYTVDEEAVEEPDKHDPFGDAAAKTVAAEPEKKAEAVQDSVERGVENEKYTPTDAPRQKPKKPKAKPLSADNPTAKPIVVESAPGEDIDPADIASVRAMLSGGK
jgi:hypothetical protein